MRENHKPRALTKAMDSSEEDNELEGETISGENDVEYAEFSLSVRTSPKEHIQDNSIDSANSNGIDTVAKMDGFDDFMVLPISTLPSNISSKCKHSTINTTTVWPPLFLADIQSENKGLKI